MKVKEITDFIETIAPLAYQESYDNAGLICGDYNMDISAILICLDSTEAVIDEAISKGCNMLIAHHPIVFSGLKKFNGKNYVERVIIKAIQNNIAIYASHTNLDNVIGGVNSKIAEKLGLTNCSILIPQSGHLKRLITYAPKDKAEDIRKSLFAVGAGSIGNYDECSFNTEGIGTFRAGERANPFVGKKEKLHYEQETKIEVVYSSYIESRVLETLLETHPYEEVAYDLISLTNRNKGVGAGMIGDLAVETDEITFLKQLKEIMKTDCIRYTNLRGKNIKKVSVCGGSGSFVLQNAIQKGADVLVTSDLKYHQFFDAESHIIIADIGHYESEQFTMELFYELIRKKFNTFALHLSKINTNPINYL